MKKSICVIFVLVIFFLGTHACTETETVPIYTYRVINAYPHDDEAFTQGLVFEGGHLYEGTGQRAFDVQ